jgi:hypothetical protein
MADTLSIAVNSAYQSLTGKTLSIQAELLSKMKTAIVDIDYDTVVYDTGGNIVDLGLDGRITTIISVEVLEVTTGHVGTYIPGAANAAALGKLKLYYAGTAGAALDEVTSSEATTLTCKLRIYGFQ